MQVIIDNSLTNPLNLVKFKGFVLDVVKEILKNCENPIEYDLLKDVIQLNLSTVIGNYTVTTINFMPVGVSDIHPLQYTILISGINVPLNQCFLKQEFERTNKFIKPIYHLAFMKTGDTGTSALYAYLYSGCHLNLKDETC